MSVTIRRYSVDDGAEYSPSSSEGSRGCRHSSVIDAAACSSQSTAPTSVSGSPRLLDRKAVSSSSVSVTTVPLHHLPYPEKSRCEPYSRAIRAENLPPSTVCCPRASADSYASDIDSEIDRDEQSLDSASEFSDDESDGPHNRHGLDTSNRSIPPLPEYRHDIVDKYVCPSTPQEFAQLFPSLDRMSVRHDDFTTDGNMCLRVDVAVPVGSHRLLTSYQLFHLRMYDLSKREFSLRRYCRDSGREVCNSKLTSIESVNTKIKASRISRREGEEVSQQRWRRRSTASSRSSGNSIKADAADFWSALQRSMNKAFHSLGTVAPKPAVRLLHSSNHSDRRPATSHAPYSRDHQSNKHTTTSSRRSLSTSVPELHGRGKLSGRASLVHLASALKPTNVIKLEFSNYARVDLERRGGNNNIVHDNTRYCYEWWGHKYTWKRFIGKHLDVPSYHLLRDDNGDQPIAHIVPETRSPNQVDTDELAGGWIPPCHMWIADPSVLTAETDVADVIVSTGLIALVDDFIRIRWQSQKMHHNLHVPLISRTFPRRVTHTY